MKKYLSIGVIAFILAGCSRSPEPRYFSLVPLAGPVSPELATAIKIQRPVMAGYLDRLDFVRQKDDYQLLIDNTDNWVEPLDAMFARTLAADLQQRLPASIVVTEEDSTPLDVRFTIALNVQRFNQRNDGNVTLQGDLVVDDRITSSARKHIPVQLTADAVASPQSVASGLSRLVSDIATIIVQDAIIPDMQAHGATSRAP